MIYTYLISIFIFWSNFCVASLAKTMNVEAIELVSDLPFDKGELENLIGFYAPCKITIEQIGRAKASLLEKGCFKRVQTRVKSNNFSKRSGVVVTFIFEANWCLSELKIVGGGEIFRYDDLYLIKKGEPFHLAAHEESIELITEALSRAGYFLGTVNDKFEFDVVEKKVFVELEINFNKSFIVKNSRVRFYGFMDKNHEKIRKSVNSNCKRWLCDKRFDQVNVELCSKEIRELLKEFGLHDTRVSFSKKVDYKNCLVDLFCDVSSVSGGISVLHGSKMFLDQICDGPTKGKISPIILREVLSEDSRKKGFVNKKINKLNGESLASFGAFPLVIEDLKISGVDEEHLLFLRSCLQKRLLSKKISSDEINKAISFVARKFVTNGYWDFCLSNINASKINDKGCILNLAFNLGKKRVVDSVILPKNIEIVPNLGRALKTKTLGKDVAFDPFWIEEQKKLIESCLRYDGFWDSKTDISSIQRDDGKGQILVSIVCKVIKGNKAVFGPVVLQGNAKIPFEKIKSRLQFEENDWWDKAKLEQSRKQLDQLGIFKEVKFTTSRANSSNSSRIPVCLTLVDDDPFELKLHAGFVFSSSGSIPGSEFGRASFESGCSLIAKNRLGCADTATLGFDLRAERQSVDFLYQLPNAFGLPLTVELKGGSGRRLSFSPVYQNDRYWANNSGIYAGVWKDWLNGCKFETYLGIEFFGENAKKEILEHQRSYFICEPIVSIENISGEWSNRSGYALSCALKTMLPISKNGPIAYALMFRMGLFTPLRKGIVAVLRSDLCDVFSPGVESLSGMNSCKSNVGLAGSSVGSMFPPLEDRILHREKDYEFWEVSKMAAKSFVSLHAELRAKIFNKLSGVIFDRVLAQNEMGWLQINDYSNISGVGARYATPIGMICADAAVRWREFRSGGNPWIWRVGLGKTF
jgi:outer membrane protein assembly factor BamA